MHSAPVLILLEPFQNEPHITSFLFITIPDIHLGDPLPSDPSRPRSMCGQDQSYGVCDYDSHLMVREGPSTITTHCISFKWTAYGRI